MQTYSHLILTAVLSSPVDRLARQNAQRLPLFRPGALLLGSVLPDLPLIFLSIFAILRDATSGVLSRADFAAAPVGAPPPAELIEASMTVKLFEVWFFENPWVITAQNLFHSPLLVIIFIILGYAAWRRGRRWSGWFFWLFCAALLHTLIDIPLHVTDGPLLLFPLNWSWRFISPVSYWDPNYYGREWSFFEHALMLILLVFLGLRYRKTLQFWRRRHVSRPS